MRGRGAPSADRAVSGRERVDRAAGAGTGSGDGGSPAAGLRYISRQTHCAPLSFRLAAGRGHPGDCRSRPVFSAGSIRRWFCRDSGPRPSCAAPRQVRDRAYCARLWSCCSSRYPSGLAWPWRWSLPRYPLPATSIPAFRRAASFSSMPADIAPATRESFAEALRRNPGISDVAISDTVPLGHSFIPTPCARPGGVSSQMFRIISISPNFADALSHASSERTVSFAIPWADRHQEKHAV